MATVTRSETLAVSPRIEDRMRRGELSPQQVEEFHGFLQEVDHELLHHPIVLDNAYTRWFQEGRASDAELRHFVQQFSVFSNQFLVAALLRVINAPSLPQARSAKEILLNELGVIYRRTSPGQSGVSTEDAKVASRNIRRDANKHFEQAEKDKEMSEDERDQGKESVQDLLKKFEAKIDEMADKKSKEILEQ